MLTIAREDNLRLSAPRQTFCRAGELLFRSSLTLWSGSQTVVLMLKALLLAPVLLFALSVCASAQTKPDPQDVRQSDPSQKSGEDMGPAAEEIMRRAEIRREEDSHKEMVERADEAAQIGDEILTAYKKKKSLSGDDLKKLERLDKLAHKIRGGAGGSDDDEVLENPPDRLADAVARLAEISDTLNKSVQKTSRLVISAAVIKHSNELIELIKRIRSIQQP